MQRRMSLCVQPLRRSETVLGNFVRRWCVASGVTWCVVAVVWYGLISPGMVVSPTCPTVCQIEHPDTPERRRWFGRRLLEGKVIPVLAQITPMLTASPMQITRQV